MSGPGRAAAAGGSQGDGGQSRLIGWEAGAEGPPVGRSLVQRIARGDDHLRALVREGDPRLKLAAQVKESRDGDYADPHTSKESPRIMTRR